LLLYPIVYIARIATYSKGISRAELLNGVAMAIINVALWQLIGPTALLYLGLFFAHGLHPVAAHFIHEHYLFAGEQETYSYYGPLNLVTFNVGYHVEHHDFLNVSGWRLPELRALNADAYRGFVGHQSWTAVLWEFIVRRDLGPASRLVRSAARAHEPAHDFVAFHQDPHSLSTPSAESRRATLSTRRRRRAVTENSRRTPEQSKEWAPAPAE